MPLPQMSPRSLMLSFGALAAGAAGGSVFALNGLPLPWMLGALTTTMGLALAGVPLRVHDRIRPPVIAVIAVIGVLLGSGFKRELLERAGDWIWSLLALALYLVLAALATVPFYRASGAMTR